jgi:hypothetical protein
VLKKAWRFGSINQFVLGCFVRARSVAVNTPPCHGGDRRFDPGRARQEMLITLWSAFLVETPSRFEADSPKGRFDSEGSAQKLPLRFEHWTEVYERIPVEPAKKSSPTCVVGFS